MFETEHESIMGSSTGQYGQVSKKKALGGEDRVKTEIIK